MNRLHLLLTLSGWMAWNTAYATLVNIAPFGTATVAGGAFAGGNIINPQGGNDGNVATMFHTDNTTPDRGVTVTLPRVGFVARVEVVNRGGAVGGDASTDARLTGALLEVLDASDTVLGSTTLTDDPAVLGETNVFDNAGLGFAGAAKVRLTHSGNYLHASEIRAFADSAATAKPTSGAAAFGFPTANGNDGNFLNFSHGDNNTTDYWRVDLQGSYLLDSVMLVGRNAGGAGYGAVRINGATVQLLDATDTVVASGTVAGCSDYGAGYGSYVMNDAGGYANVAAIKVFGVAYLNLAEVAAFGTAPPIPAIAQQPRTVVTLPSRTATFSVVASVGSGDPALLTYQWQENGTDIAGATNTSYTTPPLALDDETNLFQCTVSYPGSPSATSAVAGIAFDYALGAMAYANGPLWANWPMSRLVDGQFVPAGAAIIHGGTNLPLGFAYTVNLGTTVTISNMVIWTRQDFDVPTNRLTNYRVSVHLDNGGMIGPEVWGADLRTDGGGASGPGIKDVLTADLDPGGLFEGQWVMITSLDNPVTDYALQIAELEVFGFAPGPILRLTQQAADALLNPLQAASFTVTAEVINGDPASLTYQWQRNGLDIPGATGTNYTTAPLCPQDDGAKFRCVVSHPGAPTLISTEVAVTLDYNFAHGATVAANQPIWPDFSIAWLADGNVGSLVHGLDNLLPGYAYTINLGTRVTIANILIWARQDGCCPERLSNYRVSVHPDAGGAPGPEVWGANLHADGSNPGSGPGAMDVVTADLDPAGLFEGQWIKIESLANPVPNYALQISEVEVFGFPYLRLEWQRAEGGLELTWPGGVLEEATNLLGPWLELPSATSPLTVPLTEGQRFFRVRCGP